MLFALLLWLALADMVRQDFVSSDWPRVAAAAEQLQVGEGIPVLLEVMAQDREVPLQDTADLIYPGASRYVGHGLVINYELNWLAGRAGWVLESLTFESFGFQLSDLTTLDIVQAAGAAGRGRSTDELRADPVVRAALRKRAGERAQAWWKQQGGRFDRAAAARQALVGNDPARQNRVLQALRSKRLPLAPYRDLIERLQHSQDSEVRKQADQLVR